MWLSFLFSIILVILLLFLICIKALSKKTDKPSFYENLALHTIPKGICCIVAYYEKDKSYRDNLTFFLRHGLRPDIDYYIVCNGATTISFPERSNLRVFHRKNQGFDFAGYSHGLEHARPRNYRYYFFMNASVRGPFLRDPTIPWHQPFIELFRAQVKLVGVSICMWHHPIKNPYGHQPPYSHVQSMFFCLDRESVAYLDALDFFNESRYNAISNIQEIIFTGEIGMSTHILEKGWNISCILEKYRGVDYRKLQKDINPSSRNGDPYYPGAYFGGTIDPYDAIFQKVNRIPLPPEIAD